MPGAAPFLPRAKRGRFSCVAAAVAAVVTLAILAQSPEPSSTHEPAEEAPEEAELREAELREAVRLRGLALAEMEDGAFDRAAEHLEKLARILPDNILPPVNLALCYLRLNRRGEALAQLRRARQLDPDNPSMLQALARMLETDPEPAELWRQVVEHFAGAHPRDPRPHYLRARRLAAGDRAAEAVPVLRQALEHAPENLVLLADLLVAAAVARDPSAVADALNGIEDRLNGLEGSLADYADRVRVLVDAEQLEALRPPAVIVRNLLRPLGLYRAHLVPLHGPRHGAAGGMFPQQDFDPPLPESIQGGSDVAITFEDASEAWGLDDLPAVRRMAIARRPGRESLIVASREGILELERQEDRFRRRISEAAGEADLVISYAVDLDEIPDLVTAGPRGVRLHPGRPDGSLGPPSRLTEPAAAEGSLGLHPLDVDHDGDLDLFVARASATDLYLQNNGDGTWPERAGALGIAGAATDTSDLAVADFEDDGDLDLLTVHPGSHPRLYLNRRTGAFVEATAAWGLDRLAPGYSRARAADFDHDGSFDLLLWGEAGGVLLFRRPQGFEPAVLSAALRAPWGAAEVGDFDNDGDQDFVVALRRGGELLLVRNRRPELTVEEMPVPSAGVQAIEKGDFDDDGDLDLVARLASGGLRFFRNQGGNTNHWLRLVLKGVYDNNAKNNVQGLFCRIEARVGSSFQVVTGNGGVNHLGLGAQRQADVVRVVWTNGLAQSWQLVAADRTLVEEQVLKGSCPFLYAWNGERFEFVTDLMWKSTLGMIFADGSAAPHQSARDFVLVPGERLRPVDGRLWLQITEELWEAVYLDRQRLLAVDRPAEVELVVDERFLPPPHPRQAPLHWIGRRLPPVAARDQQGRDVLRKVLRRDGDYVDDLPLTRYQGVTGGHHLELTFAGVPGGERLRLVLSGWIFPTDTSINFALAQDSSRNLEPPRLEVLAADGSWRTVSDFIGFPNGKRKAMVVELTDRISVGTISAGTIPSDPSAALTLRLSTSMQIYWDSAALAIGEPEIQPVLTLLEPDRADLHYRGYSRLYRESPAGPHLFDYAEVDVAPRFRDLRGAYTRYGPVSELLSAEDDRYVVMNAGDEMTVTFDASGLPPLPPGWRRDYVLYTDGWVKDGDLHTAFSQTVEPLPYHGMTGYPGRVRAASGRSSYRTRIVTDRPFVEALEIRGGSGE
ncbi:MAG: tetratricopeptide repeat protein [bacterium]|nr:tetratricopeptide repeat protein [bacterium]